MNVYSGVNETGNKLLTSVTETSDKFIFAFYLSRNFFVHMALQ